MSELNKPAGSAGDTVSGDSTPMWLTPAFIGGLVLVYLGQRVLEPIEGVRWFSTAAGVLLCVLATAARVIPQFQAAHPERRAIDRILAGLCCLGLFGLVVYFASTAAGLDALGFKDGDERDGARAILQVAYVSVFVVSLVPLVFAEFSLYPMRRAPHLESRRVRAAVLSGAALSLAAIYASLFTFAADDSDIKADYSYFKTSEPSDSTRMILQGLTEPVDIIAFFPDVNEVGTEVKSYLSHLRKVNPHLRIKMVDRLMDPELARKHRATQDGVVIFAKGDVTQTFRLGTDLGRAQKKLRKLDEHVQEALNKVATKERVAYFTVGHGELNDTAGHTADKTRTVNWLKRMFGVHNFAVKPLGSPQGLSNDVPDDADIVVMLGPSEPFSSDELAALGRYAAAGGRLFFALDPDKGLGAETLPAAASPATQQEVNAAVAELVGVQLVPGMVAHETKHVAHRRNRSDRRLLVTNKYSSHASVSQLSRQGSNTSVVVLGAAGLEKIPGREERVDFAVRSPAGTFVDTNGNFEFNGKAEQKRVYNLAAAVTKPIAAAEENGARTDELRAFVVGDVDAFTDPAVAQVLGNRFLANDAIRWLGGVEVAAGAPNSEADAPIEHTKQEDLVWFYLLILGAPVLVLTAGLTFRQRLRKPVRGAA